MSQDFQLAWTCPHLTVEEVAPLDIDRRSLMTRQPVASSGVVRILVNDEAFIPQAGLYAPAQLSGAVSGPFDLIEGEDALIIDSTSGSQTYTFGIRGTTRKTTDQIVAFLQARNIDTDIRVAVANLNGHLVLTETSKVGIESFLRVRGSASAALGFGAAGVNQRQRGANGLNLYPGWKLYTRPDEITNRFPRFDAPIKGNPIFKVTYTVPGQRCLRCGATYIENDYRFNEVGQAILIGNENLLYQAALKILLTDQNSNPYHQWYGTQIRQRIGTKAISGVAALISEDVRRALVRLQTLQDEQSKYQAVSFKERLYSIQSVDVYPHQQDPTTFMVDVWVRNASADPINLSVVFTVPSVVALMGSNGLMLGTQQAGLTPQEAATLFLPAPTDRSI